MQNEARLDEELTDDRMNPVLLIVIISLSVVLSLIFAVFSIIDPLAPLIIGLAAFVLTLFLRNPMSGLAFLVLVTPLSGFQVFNMQFAGIPGIKISTVLPAVIILCVILSARPYKLANFEKVFIIGYILLFTIAIIRSTAYMGQFTYLFWDEEYNTAKYILSHYLKPLLIFFPLIIIAKYVRSVPNVKLIINTLIISILILSVTIIFLYVFFVEDKTDFKNVRFLYGDILGMHGNNIADFYIVTYPIILLRALYKKSVFIYVTLAVSLVAIALIYSRSAYVMILLTTFACLWFTGRKRIIPILLILLLAVYPLIPKSITERAETGIGESNLNSFAAGRIDDIWIPVLQEYADDPLKMTFGAGRYGVADTMAFQSDRILSVTHMHNIYIDILIDSGIVGLVFFVLMFAIMLAKFFRSASGLDAVAERELKYLMTGIALSLASFLVRGITDSYIYASLTNSFLWITIGAGISLLKIINSADRKVLM